MIKIKSLMEDNKTLSKKLDEFETVVARFLPMYMTVPIKKNRKIKLKDLIKKYLTSIIT